MAALNPNMVYTPHSPIGSDGDYVYPNDDDNNDDSRPLHLRIRIMTIFRIVAAGLAIGNVPVWICAGLWKQPHQSGLLFVFVEMWFVIFWNAFHILVAIKSHMSSGGSGSFSIKGLPTLICQIGNWHCVCNDDEGDPSDLSKPLSARFARKSPRKIPTGAWFVDLCLGSTIFIISVAAWPASRLFYRLELDLVLSFNSSIGLLQLAIAIMGYLGAAYGHVVFEVGLGLSRKGTDRSAYRRIRLPNEVEEGRLPGPRAH